MLEFDSKLKEQLKKECSEAMYKKALSTSRENLYLTINKEENTDEELECVTIKSGGETCFVCRVCCSYLKKGNLPPKAASNCLEVVPVPENVHLESYLEEALISRTLLFMKIFSLKSSLMPALKDKCIVIPLEAKDVLNTVESLPRLPSESGIIDIQWKRKVGLKNTHLQAKVDPNKIFNALNFLKEQGHKYYLDSESREQYQKRCLENDPDGFHLVFGKNNEFTGEGTSNIGTNQSTGFMPNTSTRFMPAKINLALTFVPDGSEEPILELPSYLQQLEEQELEVNYQENDVIRKYQLDYDQSVCMVEKYPEAMQIEGVIQKGHKGIGQGEEPNQLHIVAPGEGKTPINLLYCKDFELKAFPCSFLMEKTIFLMKEEKEN